MEHNLAQLTDERLRRILREMLRANSDYAGRYALLIRVLDSEMERREHNVMTADEVAAQYAPVYDAIAGLDDATDRGPDLEQWPLFLLQRAEDACDTNRATAPVPPSDMDDWVDPTRVLTRSELFTIRRLFEQIVEATTRPAFDWETQWFAGLRASGGELAPDYPAAEAVDLDWAFHVHENSALASDEQLAPGITEYLAQLMGRAAVLGRQTAGMFRELYRDKVVMHTGVETAFALTRMELEVIGRIRAIIVPDEQPKRVKAYWAARTHDLAEAKKMTGVEQPGAAELAALLPTLEALDGEPDVRRKSPPKMSDPPLDRWEIHAGAAARWLQASNKAPDLYWKLSEALHGGGIVQEAWFANGEAFGVDLVRRCGESLRSELVELNAAYIRYATYDRMAAG